MGDISYRGSILERWEDVWLRSRGSLFDAGVRSGVALGSHELEEGQSGETVRWIHDHLQVFGYDNTYRVVPYGPVDSFFFDLSTPLLTGEK